MCIRRKLLRPVSLLAVPMMLALLIGCGSGGGSGQTVVVDTIEDSLTPTVGTMTLRAALAQTGPDDTITFAPALDGRTIELSVVGEAHSVLLGEVYAGNTFSGYEERDYGASALYARKNVRIDASGLPNGVTLKWAGGDASKARVLAVFGDLTMRNVTITGGHSFAEPIAGGTQTATLARGGGLAVWGTARLERCTIASNRCTGESAASRDRGTYGGGIYANGLYLTDTVVGGNAAYGYGAAGGGIYSVGGADSITGAGADTTLMRCTVSGNRVTAQHAYGGGIFTLSGGPKNLATMTLTNCTVARNVVEDNPDLPQAGQYYYRGGGIYMGGGSLSLVACTVAENKVTGTPAVFSNKPNMGGGGVAATVGNAHVVENVRVRHTVAVGNTLNGAAEDWFAGSILGFYSEGYNLFGALDFSQILVPVPEWLDLSRKHYPKIGDRDGATLGQALDVGGIERHASFVSVGADAGQPLALRYPPGPDAVDRIPVGWYRVENVRVGYGGYGGADDDFLNHVLAMVRTAYGSTLGGDFGSSLGDQTGVGWHGPETTWPSNPENAAWVRFWRDLDTAIAGRLGAAGLADDFWARFVPGTIGAGLHVAVSSSSTRHYLTFEDQRGASRPVGGSGDIGAVER
ncbi:MAG: hypothetical protein FJX72_06335 [Armatimonadetes bacterium]|nr:hypothetical protein [Armatimonadota bacterium]